MIALAWVLALLGCCALSATMSAHRDHIWRRAPLTAGTQRVLRVLGTVGLLASAAVCVKAQAAWDLGLVLWFGIFTAAAFVQVILLSFLRPASAKAR